MVRPTSFSALVVFTLLGNSLIASAITVEQSNSGKIPIDTSGSAGAPSKYQGNRGVASLQWNYNGPWWPENLVPPPISPKNYGLLIKGTKQPLNYNGYNANLEKNTPFVNSSKKIVGLYVTEWAYWERGYPAEFTPAKNVTHVFYSFMAMCDYVRSGATENNGLIAEGNKYGAAILKAMCGRGMFPAKTGPNYDQDIFNQHKWQNQDVGVMENNNGQPRADFELTKYDPQASQFMLKAMQNMKSANPNLKVMISIGGWTLSSPFHAMVSTKNGRDIFINSVIKFLQENSFVDGIDLDWEYIGGNGAVPRLAKDGYQTEKTRYTQLVKELRSALDANFSGNKRKQLSAAVAASPAKLAAIDFNSLKDDFDFINVMAYDLYGAFSRYPSHQAALHAKPVSSSYGAQGANNILKDEAGNNIIIGGKTQTQAEVLKNYSTEGAIKSILDNNPNFPSQKLIVGAAAYSRGWHTVKVKAEHDKLFWHGVAAGPNETREGLGVNGSFENGVTDFREIYDKNMAQGNTSHLYYDAQAEAAYIWNPKGTSGGFVSATVESFDSPRSIIAKAKFVKDYNLGGMFAWDASTDNGLIVNAMNAGLCNKKADGSYYSFKQQYAGVVNSVPNGNNSVTETISTSPQDTLYNFDGATFCSGNINPPPVDPEEPPTDPESPPIEWGAHVNFVEWRATVDYNPQALVYIKNKTGKVTYFKAKGGENNPLLGQKPGGSSTSWQKLKSVSAPIGNPEFGTAWNSYASYKKGDVVFFANYKTGEYEYYEALKNGKDENPQVFNDSNKNVKKRFWKNLGSPDNGNPEVGSTSVTFKNNSSYGIMSATQFGVWGTSIAQGQSEVYTIDDPRLLNKAIPWGYKEGDTAPLGVLYNGSQFKECGNVVLRGKIVVTFSNGKCSITNN